MYAYRRTGDRLHRLAVDEPVESAVWIDLYRPQPDQAARIEELGIDVPTLADMEEIEISNRIYRDGTTDYMTVVMTGLTPEKESVLFPVAFILTPERLVTVRYHAPRPLETFPDHADKTGIGCQKPDQVFLGLVQEIISRQADHLEGVGKSLDEVTRGVFGKTKQTDELLELALEQAGRDGELIGRLRLGLLTLERALSHFSQERGTSKANGLKSHIKTLERDIHALGVHADFLSARLGHITDVTLGLVNLSQNQTVRIVSVVAVLFLPPTLIASIYGMNFHAMPELDQPWGYPVALALMLASALGTWAFFKWRRWL